ncbi:MAG TPA: Ig-like domain-containing protein [Vicinamibacterales bacterium]|nr:Ig-like domain-containing protein [Vicinamibacterales bacterium]
MPLLAPSGSTITLTAPVNALPVNGTAQIVAQVIEPSGTPPHSGTQVTFTTTLGSIQPANVETDANGIATATFNAGGANGTATITAISGGTSASGNAAIKIAIGTAAVGSVRLGANPTILPPTGGTTALTAQVFDINGNALPNAQVFFSTTAGTLDQFVVNTDQSGIATARLTTANQATVTASVGAQGGSTTTPGTGTGTGTGSGGTGGTGATPTPTSTQSTATITIAIAGAPQIVITPPTTPPGAGLPAAYTFAVTAATTNGCLVRDLTVNWGDGQTQDLGAVTGSAVVQHAYANAGAYTIKATVTDSCGFTQTVSSGVAVTVTTNPTIIITPSVPTGSKTATFTIQITPPTGVGILDAVINFGDGVRSDLGGASGTVTVQHTYPNVANQTYTVTVTVTDTLGRTTTGQTTVNVP